MTTAPVVADAAPAPLRIVAVVLITASSAIVYELLIGTLSTYLYGDSALQFSLTIGVYLASMGAGALFARRAVDDPLPRLIAVELAVSLMGGFSGVALYAAYALIPDAYLPFMVTWTAALGLLVGMELPLLAELLRRGTGIKAAFATTLAWDYFGSLVGSLAFPLILLSTLGTVKTALATGAVNLVAVLLLRGGRGLAPLRGIRAAVLAVGLLLAAGLALAEHTVAWFEHRLYRDEIIWAQSTRFQRIVVTRYRDDLRLYSDKELQFSSRDEYRYHEALVHPALAALRNPESVLVIGGGDGMAARELLKDSRVRLITLVDVDPQMTRLGKMLPQIVDLNRGSLSDPRVRVVNDDGHHFANTTRLTFDLVIVDLPDPRTEDIARLYSQQFYRLLRGRLNAHGAIVTQASSPYYTRESFWSIAATLRSVDLRVQPYRVNVPAFGEWGFVLASMDPVDWSSLRLNLPHRYLDASVMQAAIKFDSDTSEPPNSPVSTLESPSVWRLYRRRVRYWRD